MRVRPLRTVSGDTGSLRHLRAAYGLWVRLPENLGP